MILIEIIQVMFKVSRSDYFHNRENHKALYQELFLSLSHEIVKKMSQELFDFEYTCVKGIPNIIWYQQYQKKDTHGWHDHAFDSTFSVIYYLELPRGAPGTEFRDPYTGRTHRPRVREGDIVMFPSILAHMISSKQI